MLVSSRPTSIDWIDKVEDKRELTQSLDFGRQVDQFCRKTLDINFLDLHVDLSSRQRFDTI